VCVCVVCVCLCVWCVCVCVWCVYVCVCVVCLCVYVWCVCVCVCGVSVCVCVWCVCVYVCLCMCVVCVCVCVCGLPYFASGMHLCACVGTCLAQRARQQLSGLSPFVLMVLKNSSLHNCGVRKMNELILMYTQYLDSPVHSNRSISYQYFQRYHCALFSGQEFVLTLAKSGRIYAYLRIMGNTLIIHQVLTQNGEEGKAVSF